MNATRPLAATTFALLAVLAPAGLAADANAPAARPLPALAGTSVSIPWRELRALLDAARPRPAAPPVAFVFGPAEHEVTVADGAATVVTTVAVDVLADGWVTVPIGPADGALREAATDGEPCPVVARDGGQAVLLSGRGRRALRVVRRPAVSPGRDGLRRVPLALPGGPIATVAAALPAAGLEVNVDGADDVEVAGKPGATVATFHPRGGKAVTLSWRPRPARRDPRLYATAATLATVEPGGVRCRSDVRLEVLAAPIRRLRIALPAGATLLHVDAPTLAEHAVADDAGRRVLTLTFAEDIAGELTLALRYALPFPADAEKVSLGVPSVMGTSGSRGQIGVEVRGGLEVEPAETTARRIDVRELAGRAWSAARAPVSLAFRYAGGPPSVGLAVRRHADAEVLIAFSDVCEAATTVTPEGKAVTKMIFVMRNNLKPHLRLKLPEGARVWSVFVDDRPVRPRLADDGELLVPLVRSEGVDPDDEEYESYVERRDRRRRLRRDELDAPPGRRQRIERMEKLEAADDRPAELKPYDVEIVFVGPAVEPGDRGELALALPRCDVPVGHLAWAVMLPDGIGVMAVEGSCRDVERFSLPFPHFADAAHARRFGPRRVEQAAAAQKEVMEQLAEQARAVRDLAAAARDKGVLPVRVELPITPTLVRLEQLLVTGTGATAKLFYRRRR